MIYEVCKVYFAMGCMRAGSIVEAAIKVTASQSDMQAS